jgi:hypothetical protein
MGGEGFCRDCIRGELPALRSQTVHKPADEELLKLQIRCTTGGRINTYMVEGCTAAVRMHSGMHASQTFRWNVGFIDLVIRQMSRVCLFTLLRS